MNIQLNNISRDYHISFSRDISVLTDLNLEISAGSFVVLLGESGCGKSTLLSIIAGLIPPTSGSVFADGQEITGPSPARTLLFQQPSLLPWLSVAENISFGCKLRGESDNLKSRTNKFIEMVGLSGFENLHPPELSVGMAQRVSIARALIGKPDVLLLDEPFGALDTFNRTRLQEELIKFWKQRKFTTIFVTHDIDEAIALGEKIVFLGGKPCTNKAIYDNDLPYPRDITSESFFKVRASILRELQEVVNLD